MPRTTRRSARAPRAPTGRTHARTRAGRIARWLFLLGIVGLVGAGAYMARRPLLIGAGKVLIDRDDLRPADAILLLAGDIESRPQEAVRLYRKGLAPRIVIAREHDLPSVVLGVQTNKSELAVRVLERLGVPSNHITFLQFPGGTTSTYDEARAFREWAYNVKPHSVIVVTHLFHTRRAGWLIRGQLERLRVQVMMDPVRAWDYDERNWWQTESGLIDWFEEWPKILHEMARD